MTHTAGGQPITVSNIARRKDEVVTADPETSVYDLAQLMEANTVGSVVIERDNEVAGIVTDHDIALKIVGEQRQFEDKIAEDIMTEEVFTADANTELFELFTQMGDHSVRRIPVVDDDELAGIVTLDDLLAVLHSEMGNVTEVVEAESPPHPTL